MRPTALALASIAFAVHALAQSGPEQQPGAAPFQRGLARQMREAAQHLKNGERYEAMEALNGARHLSKTSTSAPAITPEASKAFHEAEGAVNKARAQVQNGRPEQAPEPLESAADILEQAKFNEPPTADQAILAKAPGRTALDDRGRRIGSVRGVSPSPGGGFQVRISSGGLLGIGATERSVQAPAVLVGKNYVAIGGEK